MDKSADSGGYDTAIQRERTRIIAIIDRHIEEWELVQVKAGSACNVNVLSIIHDLRQLRDKIDPE